MLACPPVATDSSTTVLSPSEAPYSAAANPAGPAPTTTRSEVISDRSGAAHPKRPRQLGIARVAQHSIGTDEHDRALLRRHAEALQDLLRSRIRLQVDPVMRQPVADRELPQAPGIRRIARTDDPEPDPQPDHDRAPHDQRPQDQVAQHDVLSDDLAQTTPG